MRLQATSLSVGGSEGTVSEDLCSTARSMHFDSANCVIMRGSQGESQRALSPSGKKSDIS
jgi:hypothetical protein